MAVTVVAQVQGNIVNVGGGFPTDVESDSTASSQGTYNIFVTPSQAGSSGFLTLEPIASTNQGTLTSGVCTITVSQGSGTLNVSVTW